MKTTKYRVVANPPRKSGFVKFRRGLSANVHWGCVWINGCSVDLGAGQLKPLVKALLDAGIPVRGYWADVDYTSIDKRISSEGGRV